MRKIGVVLALAALPVGMIFFGSFFVSYIGPANSVRKDEAQTAPSQHNIVFILADDMRKDDLQYMPKTRSLLKANGMSFTNDFVSVPVCCPSRATIMRGQYAHNTGVLENGTGPNGGWQGYQSHGNEQDNVATRLQGTGYRTGLIGKYLNGYDASTVPQGWTDWFAIGTEGEYYDYDVNDNGTVRRYGSSESDYSTDVIAGETRHFIGASVRRGKPFFAYVAPEAPHYPSIPAPRHEHAYDGLKAPRPPSFNETDVSDKPSWIRSLPSLSDDQIAQIDLRYENRAESLQAVDELVKGVVARLQHEGVLDNTYIFFTSDNGFQHGEHRIEEGKGQPYEESIHVPLLVRGPGVAAGSRTNEVALNTDFLPTITDLAGVETPSYVDGRSLRPVLQGGSAATSWRSAILLEDYHGNKAYVGIRTSDGRKYIEYESGLRELYDLSTDPYELTNSYDANAQPDDLVTRLQALKSCAGVTCRQAENGP